MSDEPFKHESSCSKHRYEFEGGKSVCITQVAGYKGTTGGVVWDCAVLLAQWLAQGHLGSLCGKKIIELGSGTGLLGISCALLGAHVTLTDLDEQLEMLKFNVSQNCSNLEYQPKVKRLLWGDDLKNGQFTHEYDLILCSDCVYCAHRGNCLDSLSKTIQDLCLLSSEHTKTVVIILFQERLSWIENKFMEELKHTFTCESIPSTDFDLQLLHQNEDETSLGISDMFEEDLHIHAYKLILSSKNIKE